MSRYGSIPTVEEANVTISALRITHLVEQGRDGLDNLNKEISVLYERLNDVLVFVPETGDKLSGEAEVAREHSIHYQAVDDLVVGIRRAAARLRDLQDRIEL